MRGGYTFGTASTADLAELVDLLEAQVLEHPIGHLILQRERGGWAPFLVRVMELGTIRVAREWKVGGLGRILGAIAAVALPHQLSGDLYADEVLFYVWPEARGGLLGPKLLEQLIEWGRSKSVHVLKCSSPAGSELGDYYRRLGFVEAETAFVLVL